MNEAYRFIDVIKSILVCACLMATLCATCRQEQTNDKIRTQIDVLKAVSEDFQECAIREGDR